MWGKGRGLWTSRRPAPNAYREGSPTALAVQPHITASNFQRCVSRNTLGSDRQGLRKFLFSINKHSYSTQPGPTAVSDASQQIQHPSHLLPRSRPPSGTQRLRQWAGLPWAGDTAPQPSSWLTPVTIYGHFQAPAAPPRPCLLPRSRGRHWAGPRSSQPIHGQMPSWLQSPGPRGRGRIPSERPRASLCSPQGQRSGLEQSMPPSSLETEEQPLLKGACACAGSGLLPGRGHVERPRAGPTHHQPPSAEYGSY